MFSKKKQEIIGMFEDENGFIFQLVKKYPKRWFDKNDEGTAEILFCSGGEPIPSWEAPKIKLDLSKSTKEAIQHFVDDYLKSSSNIRSCLVSMQFPMDNVMAIWNGLYKENTLIKETLLAYQNVLASTTFIESLTHEQKWVVFTQNIHRTKENMKAYETMYKEVVVNFLSYYLGKEKMDKHEGVYGEWKEFILETFENYYSENLKIEAVDSAIQITNKEIAEQEEGLKEIQKELKALDKEYEKAPISQKFKIEEMVKKVLEKEETIQVEIQELTEKRNRIKSFL